MIHKKSQMTFVTIFSISAVIILIFGIIQIVGLEASDNVNLNNDSRDYVNKINQNIDSNYGTDQLAESESVVTTDTEGQGLGEFEIEYQQTKASAEKKINILNILTNIPDTALLLFGLKQEEISFFYLWFGGVIAIIIAIASFIMFFGGGRL